jgi:ornithine cyclodeaminase/alanine dehydrogenase-like protein (mu-crystallin family)
MAVLVLTHDEVRALLPMRACIDVVADALAGLARGELEQPLRMIVRPESAAGLIALMPAYARVPEAAFGVKLIGVFPGNVARGLDAHQGAVLLISGETGALLALLNASAITALRTAAVSAVATRLLAAEDAGDLALVGAGVQARSHLEAMACVRPIRRVRVASRTPERARAFVEEMAPRMPFPIEAAPSVEAALRGADLIVTATSSHEPVLRREWIAPGAHLNAVGASLRTSREVDSATMAAARLFVDRRESTVNEAGDYLIPLGEGAIGADHIRAEIAEVLSGARPGRTAPDEITLFKSLGLAVEDLAAAAYVYRRAVDTGAGTQVEF